MNNSGKRRPSQAKGPQPRSPGSQQRQAESFDKDALQSRSCNKEALNNRGLQSQCCHDLSSKTIKFKMQLQNHDLLKCRGVRKEHSIESTGFKGQAPQPTNAPKPSTWRGATLRKGTRFGHLPFITWHRMEKTWTYSRTGASTKKPFNPRQRNSPSKQWQDISPEQCWPEGQKGSLPNGGCEGHVS